MNADEYAYLTFEKANGKKTSVSVSSLTLTISGNTLVAGSESFSLSSLTKMYFSQSDEGSPADPVANGLAFEVTEATGKMGEAFEAPTLTNPYQLSVTWSSSNEDVATVDDTGQVSLVAAGSTVITATFSGNDEYLEGSVSYTLIVEKADPVANGLAFEVTEMTGKMGEAFEAPTLTNPYQLSVAWSSSNEDVATVDDTGQVSLVAAGSTVITATFSGNDEYLAGSVSYILTVEEDIDTEIALLERNRGRVSVYTLNGIHVCSSDSLNVALKMLKRGTYIIMRDGIRFKISIK